ncbi:MAG: hypothetical protein KDC46_14330, partial [Thermoleophilia bacterium]|nr:hypothetical protein [Thermoleophilia bacterium]
ALGKGCGGDAIFTLFGGIGIEKLAAKGGVRITAGRTPGGIPYTHHFEFETPAKFPDRFQPSGEQIDYVVANPDWAASRLSNRAAAYYNQELDMTVVLGGNGVISGRRGTSPEARRSGW